MTLISMESLVREIEAQFRHVSATVVFQAVDANGDHVTVNGESIVFSPRVSIVLRDGVPDTVPDLEPTDGSFGWSVKVSILSGRYSREWLKEVPASDEVVAFGDLPNLDRATLQPTEDVVAAWDTVRAETFQARDDTQGLRDETQTLRNQAGTSADAAETARDQAQAVAASKGQPNGIGSLGSTGRQPDGEVNANLTRSALRAAYVTVRTSDGKTLPPGTVVVISIDKTLAQVTANPVADIADITFETGA